MIRKPTKYFTVITPLFIDYVLPVSLVEKNFGTFVDGKTDATYHTGVM